MIDTIYINGRFISQKITGVQRFANEVVKKISIISKKDNIKIVLLCPSNIEEVNIKNVTIKKIGKTTGYLWEQITLPRYCKKNRIHGLLNLCNLAPIRLKGNNIVVHDIRVLEKPKEFSFFYRIFFKIFTKINMKKANNIFTVSNFSKKKIESTYHIHNVTTVYSGVDHLVAHQYAETSLPNSFFYLSVGSLEANKNFKYVLEFAKTHSNLYFKIVGGKGKAFADVDYEQLSNVEFLGYVSDEELYSLYKNAKGFIFPSLYEGFGLPPLEAIAMGTKVVFASDIEVLHEIYGDTLTYFNPSDINSLDEVIKTPHIITQDERSNLINKYTWYNTANYIYKKIAK